MENAGKWMKWFAIAGAFCEQKKIKKSLIKIRIFYLNCIKFATKIQ